MSSKRVLLTTSASASADTVNTMDTSSDLDSDEDEFNSDALDDSDSGSDSEDEIMSDSETDYSGSMDDSSAYTGSQQSSNYTISDDEGDSYADLMAEMPIALGREGGATAPAKRPVFSAPLPIPAHDGPPLEGLAMLHNIRSDLEKLGQMIVKKKDGEGFLRRAHILASINMLAANVPSCVLEHLGEEIREALQFNPDGARSKAVDSLMTASVFVSPCDADDQSDLSEAEMSDFDDGVSFADDESVDYEPMEMEAMAPKGPKKRDSNESNGRIRRRPEKRNPSMGSQANSSGPKPRKRSIGMDNTIRSTKSGHSSVNSAEKEANLFERRALARRSAMARKSSAVGPDGAGASGVARKKVSISNGLGSSHTSRGGAPTRGVERSVSAMSCMSFESGRTGSTGGLQCIPSISYFQCALLFLDISGFTKLSTLLDPESLSKVINSYFQALTDKIVEFDGDIQKFAGDAVFAAWQPSATMSLAQCVEAAAACATQIVKDCSDFPVMAFGAFVDAGVEGQGSIITTLNIHCGLGVGDMAGIHVGDSTYRREYLYVGDAISQATEACDNAALGEVVVSKGFERVLAESGAITQKLKLNEKKGLVIADRGVSKMNTEHMAKLVADSAFRVRNANSRGITHHVDGLKVEALIEYRRLMSLYVHPVVVSNDVTASSDFKSSKIQACVKERHREEAELRSVYVMFIHPLVSFDMKGDADTDFESVDTLNSIMKVTTRELNRFNGHLRQMIVDDKGLVLIATFGLRGSTFPKLVSERGLPSTIQLHNALQMELGIDSRVGATFGDAYCGAVGGLDRNEYAVMGPSVNLAARLMCSEVNTGILVDNAVRHLASKSYGFNAFEPVFAKGYKDPVPIFEPLSPLERSWGKIEPNFAGRKEEIKTFVKVATEMIKYEKEQARFLMISASNGMGKTTMLAHGIEHARKIASANTRRFVVAKHVAQANDSMIPYSSIRPLFIKLLSGFGSSPDDMSIGSMASFDSSAYEYESLSGNSIADSEAMTTDTILERFYELCDYLNASHAIVSHVKRQLLCIHDGDEAPTTGGRNKKRVPTYKSTVSFIARAFRVCTDDSKFVVLAIDDIHQTDEMSWRVLQELFLTCENILIVGTSYTMSSGTLRVNDNFWDDLTDKYTQLQRFVNLPLVALSKNESRAMTMKALGLQEGQVTPELLNEVFVQSGGMPTFASEILESIKNRTDAGTCPTVAAQQEESIAEIILHRVDSFDISVRNVLNVGALLGMSFSLRGILEVLKDGETKEADLKKEIVESLRGAVNEGIIYFGEDKESQSISHEALASNGALFTFHLDVWRSTLLGLMLDSRKRTVHKKISQWLISRMETETVSIEYRKRICDHWKAAGDTDKATTTALAIGKILEDELKKPLESIALYEEMMELWGWDKDDEESIAGFSGQVLELIGVSDLSSIVSLMVAHGRAKGLTGEHTEMVAVYEDALRVFLVASVSDEVEDRSIIFPAFIGLSDAIATGHLEQDKGCRYEQAMLRRFLEETRGHGRLIHHIHALYLQFQLHAKVGAIEKALAVHSVIKRLYKVENHSKGLQNVYGMDSGALSFSFGTYWRFILGKHKQALKQCRSFLKDVLPKVNTDFKQSFSMMYPLTLTLMGNGYSSEARAFFEKIVIRVYGQPRSGLFYLAAIYRPLLILFDLTGKKRVKREYLAAYLKWATDIDNCHFGEQLNTHLARLGRCGDSISAEICTMIAASVPEGKIRDFMLTQGKTLADEAMAFCQKHRFKIAQEQVRMVHGKLKVLGCG